MNPFSTILMQENSNYFWIDALMTEMAFSMRCKNGDSEASLNIYLRI